MRIVHIIAMLFLTLCFLWAVGFGVFSAFALLAPPYKNSAKMDAIVVLTGGDNRIQTGLGLLADGVSHQLFISGVHKDVTKNEILALWTGTPPLPACCITLGYEATSTTENGQETRGWIHKNRYSNILLVTGNYHMARALLELQHALPEVKIHIHPVEQPDLDIKTRRFWELLLLEYHKTLYRGIDLLFNEHP